MGFGRRMRKVRLHHKKGIMPQSKQTEYQHIHKPLNRQFAGHVLINQEDLTNGFSSLEWNLRFFENPTGATHFISTSIKL